MAKIVIKSETSKQNSLFFIYTYNKIESTFITRSFHHYLLVIHVRNESTVKKSFYDSKL